MPLAQFQEGLKPLLLGIAEILHVIEGLSATEQGANSDNQHIHQIVKLPPFDSWLRHLAKVRYEAGLGQCLFVPIFFRMQMHPTHLYTPAKSTRKYFSVPFSGF